MGIDLTTGHPEIDHQHNKLGELVKALDAVCETQLKTGRSCLQCAQEHHSACNNRLAQLISDLLCFMLDHFAYEEKLMRFLPDTEECRKHIQQHQYAHAEISRLLSNLTAELDRENPQQAAQHLRNVLVAWLGKHGEHLDRPLVVSLDGAYEVELDYDKKLTNLLGM